MLQKALFDPGFAPLVYSFRESIEAIDMVMRAVKVPNQRKFKFKLLQKQIVSIVENSIAFYLGCLMWAKYLKEVMSENEILNNPFLGINLDEKNITQEDFCAEINLLISYFDRYKRDTKFYLGKEFVFNEKWFKIAQCYKEFLVLNDSFVRTKYGFDLILPKTIDDVVIYDNNKNAELIKSAIANHNLSLLFD